MSIRERLTRAAGAEARPDRRTLAVGYGAAAGAALFAGLIPVVAKRDLGGLDPILVSGFNNLFAGLVLLPLALPPRVARRDAPRLAFIALVGVVVAPLLYFTGLRGTTASEASVLVNAETVFTLLLAALILRERVGPLEVALVAAIVVGAIVLSTNLGVSMSPEHLAANGLIVLGMAFWGFDNIVSAGLTRRSPPWSIAAWKNLLGASAVVGGAFLLGVDFAKVEAHLPALLLVGCVGIGASLTLFYISLRHLDAYRTSAVFGLQGVAGAAGGYLFIGERLSAVQLAASAVMIGAVFVLALTHRAGGSPQGGPAVADGPAR